MLLVLAAATTPLQTLEGFAFGASKRLNSSPGGAYLPLVKIHNIRRLANKAIQEPRPSAVVPEDNRFEAERVLDDQVATVGRGRRKKMIAQYWVKWKEYPEDGNSWVNEDDIDEVLITAYRAEQSLA
jgi:hypothetical protein